MTARTDGPADDAPRVALGTDIQREGLSRVHPRDRQPCSAEGRGVQEDEERRGAAILRGLRRVLPQELAERAGQEERGTLHDRAPPEADAAPEPVNRHYGKKRAEHVGDLCEIRALARRSGTRGREETCIVETGKPLCLAR